MVCLLGNRMVHYTWNNMADAKSGRKKEKVNAPVREVAASAPLGQKRIVAGVCAALVLACIAVYGQTLSHEFVNYDDPFYVTDNMNVQAGLHLKSVGWAFVTDKALYFHPLTWMSHMLDCSLYGLNPWGHHLTSLLFHTAASVLLFLALRILTGALWPSAAVAALFAVHPLHVESVAWIAERKDVLSAFFWMQALGAYGLYARRRGAVRYAAVVAAFVLGLMSKPMVVTLPFVLLLLDYWPLDRVDRTVTLGAMAQKTARLTVEKIPLFLITLVSCASTLIMQVGGNNLSFGAKVPWLARCANAMVVYVLYLVKTVWPAGLAAFYPHPITRPLWQVAGAALILAAITLFCLRHARRRPYLIVGWLWYLGTLVPVIELVQAGEFSHADRYTYLPLIGVFIMVAWGVADLAAAWRVPGRALAAASCAAIVVLTLCAGVQTGYWRDSRTLFNHAIAVGQESSLACNCLGQLAMKQKRYDDARKYLTRAVELKPDYVGALTNLGKLAMDQGHYEDARAYVTRALDLDPGYVDAINNMGAIALCQGRYDESSALLTKVLSLRPDHLDALYNMGGLAIAQKRNDDAKMWLTKLLDLRPAHVDALINLAGVAIFQGKYDEAIPSLKRAMALDPKNIAALNNLGLCYKNKKEYETAQRYLRDSLALDPQNIYAMKTMGDLLAEMGRKEEAGGYRKKAVELSKGSKKE